MASSASKRRLRILFFMSLFSCAYAARAESRWGVGIIYPGAGVRYLLNDRWTMEGRAQIETGTYVGGVRVYRYFNDGSRVRLFGTSRKTSLSDDQTLHRFKFFAGAETDYVQFKGADSKGAGYAMAAFLGGEYFFRDQWSFQTDFGPAYVSLKDAGDSLSVSGIDYLINFGVNFYFGRRAPR